MAGRKIRVSRSREPDLPVAAPGKRRCCKSFSIRLRLGNPAGAREPTHSEKRTEMRRQSNYALLREPDRFNIWVTAFSSNAHMINDAPTTAEAPIRSPAAAPNNAAHTGSVA